MPTLNGVQIRELIKSKGLIRSPACGSDGQPSVEAASYDLRVGIALWRDRLSGELQTRYFDENGTTQAVVTLQPGQMVFVITHEELRLPPHISGTVYSRNKLQKENILALNAGHIDPGFDGPIIIRLINLGAQGWPLKLGDAVFTVVFHTVAPDPECPELCRTKEQTLAAATTTAVHAFSNPFHDLYKDEIARQLAEYYSKAENNIRAAFYKEFYPRGELKVFAIELAALVVAEILLITKVPWGSLWNWVAGP